MNGMRLSQNQNHPLINNPPHQHPPNSFPEPPASHSPGPNYYWQQPQTQRLPQNCGTMYNKQPPGQYVPNSSTGNYSVPPPQNAPYGERTMTPVDQTNQSHKLPNQDFYPPMDQTNKPSPYSNGTGFAPPASQYNHPNSNVSNMHARYPPAPMSPNAGQANSQSNAGAVQYSQASNTLPPQNRMGTLPQQPQPPVQNRRLDPDNMPSPVCTF